METGVCLYVDVAKTRPNATVLTEHVYMGVNQDTNLITVINVSKLCCVLCTKFILVISIYLMSIIV